MRAVLLTVVVLAGLAGCGPAPVMTRTSSPVPEVTDPPPPHYRVLNPIGPVLVDNDADGDYFETCATEAEDHDGFQDGDGCADPDNDGDGILDERDSCPDAAGTDDFAGCPDTSLAIAADLDGDGAPPVADRCPGPAEDADGFEDDDGCPDSDDDADGLIDPLDACPRAAGPGNGCP